MEGSHGSLVRFSGRRDAQGLVKLEKMDFVISSMHLFKTMHVSLERISFLAILMFPNTTTNSPTLNRPGV